jgi:adenylosuccinate synthase
MVIRAFPIRVAGHSGPLSNEVEWQEITSSGRHKRPLVEYTSVTKAVRRVARFDPSIVRAAVLRNSPTRVVLNHVDYVDSDISPETGITTTARKFVRTVENLIDRHVDLIGLGPASLLPASSYRMERVK